jgi:hypothetical protein
MDLSLYIENIHRQMAIAAQLGDDDSRALAEHLIAPLDATIRLTLQEALAAAAEEITCELAPGSVELRLRGRDLEFVVTAPPVDASADDLLESDVDTTRTGSPAAAPTASSGGDDGGRSRINLRMPENLKARVEQAADADGLSVNAWLVRAAGTALERTDPGRRNEHRPPPGSRRYSGWVR